MWCSLIVGDVGPNFSTALWAVVSFCLARVHWPYSMCLDFFFFFWVMLWSIVMCEKRKNIKNGKQFDQKSVLVHKPSQRVSYSFFFYRFMFLILSLVCLKTLFFFNYLVYFCYYLLVSLQFFVLFVNPIVLFQLFFSFIYGNFSKKFSISAK